MLVAGLVVKTASDEAIALLKGLSSPLQALVAAQDIEDVFWASVAVRRREAEICRTFNGMHYLLTHPARRAGRPCARAA